MKRQAWLVTILALSVPFAAHTQSTRSNSSPYDQSEDQETVYLSPFEVSSDRVSGYTVTDSAASRIRRPLLDTPTSIQVVTSEFMDDVGAASILDATQYLSGVSYPVLGGVNGVQERQTVRGFEIFGSTTDNFTPSTTAAAVDPAVIDRVEVVKGPHTILAPSGPPGGSANILTKSPKFEDRSHILKAEVADQYFGNKGTLDSTGRIFGSDKFAYRVVATYRDSKSYVPGHIWNKTVNPMLTWKITERSQLKLKGFFSNWGQNGAQAANANNLYLRDDFPVGGTVSNSPDNFRPGYVPFEANGAPDWIIRDEKLRRGTAEFTTAIGDRMNLRVAALKNYSHLQQLNGGLFIWRPDLGNRVNPYTGDWTENEQWALQNPSQPYDETSNPYISTPIDFKDSVKGMWLTENVSHLWNEGTYLQADLSGKFDFGGSSTEPLLTLNIVTGVSRGRQKSRGRSWGVPGEDVTNDYDLDYHLSTRSFLPHPTRPSALTWVRRGFAENREGGPGGTGDGSETIRDINTQYYVNTSVDTFKGRLIWTAGTSRREYSNRNVIHSDGHARKGIVNSSGGHSKMTPSFGLLYKVRPDVSVYLSHTLNTEQGSWYTGRERDNQPIWQDGKQQEAGLKLTFFNRRLSVTTSYFEIRKTNIAQSNPLNRGISLQPGERPLYPDLLMNITNEGVEVDVAGQITNNLSVLGSFTSQKMRDALGRRRANVPDTMLNGMVRYKFPEEKMKGLAMHLGFNHAGDVPGENRGAAPTPLDALELSGFYLPERTFFNAGASFNLGEVSFQLNVDNLLDSKKPHTSGGRHAIGIVPPRNIRLTTTYKF